MKPRPPGFALVYEDQHLVVIEKPEGVMTVPWERRDEGTALDLIRDEWRRQRRQATRTPLFTVHRLDKDTSGLLVFAKTKPAERGLHDTFKNHRADRTYLAVTHGDMPSRRIESVLVPDRGDGLRGSLRPGKAPRPSRMNLQGRRGSAEGQRAVTHVEAVERLPAATLVRVRLETGRTHQIRIHLAEAGHPIVGEQVYIRDFRRRGGDELRSKRLMLHAATLAFDHPVTGERLAFEAAPPATFVARLAALRGDRNPGARTPGQDRRVSANPGSASRAGSRSGASGNRG